MNQEINISELVWGISGLLICWGLFVAYIKIRMKLADDDFIRGYEDAKKDIANNVPIRSLENFVSRFNLNPTPYSDGMKKAISEENQNGNQTEDR